MSGSYARKLSIATGLVGWLAIGATAQPAQPIPKHTEPVPLDAPSVRIGNGLIQAKIYLTDSDKGFYRGTRFDQSGVIGSLTLGHQNFYGPWFDRVSLETADFVFTPDGIVAGPDSAICGPAEEFAPIGFDEAPPGGTFLKIGVGVLKKPDAKPYDHYRIYDIANAGRRDVRQTKSSVTFTQDIAGAFRYEKTLRLVPGKPQMRIEHILTNTGSAPISTSVYDHNFLKLSPGNGDVVVTLPFAVTADKAPDADMTRIHGNRISYVRALGNEEIVAFHITGFKNTKRDYDIKIDDTKTGAGVRVIGDQPLSNLHFWSIRNAIAVEPYINIELAPGATERWTYTYIYKSATSQTK